MNYYRLNETFSLVSLYLKVDFDNFGSPNTLDNWRVVF